MIAIVIDKKAEDKQDKIHPDKMTRNAKEEEEDRSVANSPCCACVRVQEVYRSMYSAVRSVRRGRPGGIYSIYSFKQKVEGDSV